MNAPVPAAPAATPPSPPAQARTASPAATTTASAASGTAAAALARAGAINAARPPVAAAAKAPADPAPVAATKSPWQAFFSDWPEQIPKRGIIVTRQNEASPFKAFMIRGEFLMLERVSPDSLGGRFLVLPFEEVAVVKFTDPLKQPDLQAAGFVGKLSS